MGGPSAVLGIPRSLVEYITDRLCNGGYLDEDDPGTGSGADAAGFLPE